ncbi:MAG: hypothetical protein M3R21_07945 [Candidatus Dormibacteraeota bacterium]|nr:hypothetical protein [Candidatus Dormibacteraeota bacterium]
MNLRSRVTKSPVRALLLAAVCLLALAAAPVFAVSTGLIDLPSSDVRAAGPQGAGTDEAEGANGNVNDDVQNQAGTDEAEGANGNVNDGAADQEGADQQDQPPSGG